MEPNNRPKTASQDPLLYAMRLRAEWLRALGVAEEEVAELCDPEIHPANADEEVANLVALRRMRFSRWSC